MNIDKGFVWLTTAIVVLLGIIASYNILQPPPNLSHDEGSVRSAVISQRKPASALSIETALTTHGWSKNKMVTWDLGCLSKSDSKKARLRGQARQVRLKGTLCQPGSFGKIQKVEIVNRSNGFRGMAFRLPSGGFTSDYLELIEGNNHFFITITSDDSVKVLAERTFVRRPSSSTQ